MRRGDELREGKGREISECLQGRCKVSGIVLKKNRHHWKACKEELMQPEQCFNATPVLSLEYSISCTEAKVEARG